MSLKLSLSIGLFAIKNVIQVKKKMIFGNSTFYTEAAAAQLKINKIISCRLACNFDASISFLTYDGTVIHINPSPIPRNVDFVVDFVTGVD